MPQTVPTECGVFVIFGMAITEDSELSTGVGTDVWVSEGMRDKWMHLAHVYTSNVQVYVNGTIRRDWIKDDIDTGNSYPLQFGRWTEEDNNLGRTFKGLLDDFRVYDDWLNASDVSKKSMVTDLAI